MSNSSEEKLNAEIELEGKARSIFATSFDDPGLGLAWFDHPKRRLAGMTPREAVRAGQPELVVRWLAEMEHGFVL